MKVNVKKVAKTENEVGTIVNQISPIKQLRRLVLAHMLWEDQFYTDGVTSTEAMKNLIKKVNPEQVANLAIQARTEQQLRHVPLFLARELARIGKLQAETLTEVIQRADEISEFMAIYWKDGKTAIANQVKKGLAAALNKFGEYQLAKWDKNSAAISLRDILFLTHAEPKDQKQEEIFRKLANKELTTPDTWEVALSAGANKADTFSRLMAEKKLGALAFIRNLRGMLEAGVPESEIRAYAKVVSLERVLPFRFITAARHAPRYEDMLEDMMLRSCEGLEKLPGRTVLVIDTSGSMGAPLSGKSELNRMDAAAALAILAREMCEEVVIYATAGSDGARKHATMLIPPRRGFALSQYITGNEVRRKIGGGGIFLVQVMDYIAEKEKNNTVDRVLVFTDEQDCDYDKNPASAKRPGKFNYIMNIASYQNGINSDKWELISGFSEHCLNYIREVEKDPNNGVPNINWPFPINK